MKTKSTAVVCSALAILTFLNAWAADETVTGNLTVTGNVVANGTIDTDGNVLSFGTQSGSPGVGLIYQDNSADTLTFYTQRNPASWLWLHNAIATGTVPAMRLDATHTLSLYQSDGVTVGVRLEPATNTLSLGTATLYRDASGALKTDGALSVGGVFTAPSLTSTTGVLTGDASGLSLNAGGVDQNILLTPTGTGAVVANGSVRATGTVSNPAFSFISDSDSGLFPVADGKIGLASNATRTLTVGQGSSGTTLEGNGGLILNADGAVQVNAGGTDQAITLTATGAGNIALLSPLTVAKDVPVVAQFRRTNSAPADIGLAIGADNAGPYIETLVAHNLRVRLNGTEAARFAMNGNFLLGTAIDSGNGKVQLASHTTPVGGIGFGPDTNLYRSGAGILKTDGQLIVAGNTRLNGVVRIVPQGDLSMGEFTAEAP